MKSFMEFVQLKNEAEEPTPAAGAAPAAPAAPAPAGGAAPAPAPVAGAAAQQQNTPTNQLLDYLEKNKSNIKHYRKFAKVKARQSAGGEEVQTKLNDRNESEVRTTQPNDWVVSNIESQGENQIVDDKTFRKRYDVANPKGDIYSPKAAEFFGVVYNGEKISFAPPNWGGDIMHIEKGYMIGGPNPNEFNKDFYGIDPVAFSKTYKTADQVAESTWMLEVFGRTNEGVLDADKKRKLNSLKNKIIKDYDKLKKVRYVFPLNPMDSYFGQPGFNFDTKEDLNAYLRGENDLTMINRLHLYLSSHLDHWNMFSPWGGHANKHLHQSGFVIGADNSNTEDKSGRMTDHDKLYQSYKWAIGGKPIVPFDKTNDAHKARHDAEIKKIFSPYDESVVGAAKGFVKGAGMVGTGLVDTLGGSKVASARLWADHKLALAQGKKLVDVTSGSGRGGASTTLTYDDGHTLDISSYPPDWLGKLLVKGGSVTYNERPITSSLNPTGMQGLMSNNNESWMRSIFGESPSKKNYDGINEIFGLFGKKPAPAAAVPAAPAAPAKKEPVANCPFCKTKSVVNTTHFEGGGSQRYKHVLQCFKCQKHWSEFYLSKQGAMIDTNNPEENKLAPTRDPIAICPFCNTKSVANSTHFEGGGSQRYASVLQCFKCQQHWSSSNAVIDPEKAIEHDKSDNIAHESCMRSFLAESFKPYKKSPYDW